MFESILKFLHLELIKVLKVDLQFFGVLTEGTFHWIIADRRKQGGKLFKSTFNFTRLVIKYFVSNLNCPYLLIGELIRQGVCQVREKSGNSLYPWKSQTKVREFMEKSGKSQGISVEPRNHFLGTANWRKSIKISIHLYI